MEPVKCLDFLKCGYNHTQKNSDAYRQEVLEVVICALHRLGTKVGWLDHVDQWWLHLIASVSHIWVQTGMEVVASGRKVATSQTSHLGSSARHKIDLIFVV